MTSACVVGLGYVGLPLAVALADAGVEVVGCDVDPLRVTALRSGRSGIEDVPDAALSGITFTSDPTRAAGCTTYVLCVPTPLREGMPDLGAVESAARAVATVLSAGDLTPHAAFDLELVRREAPRVLDTRAAVPPGERVFRL